MERNRQRLGGGQPGEGGQSPCNILQQLRAELCAQEEQPAASSLSGRADNTNDQQQRRTQLGELELQLDKAHDPEFVGIFMSATGEIQLKLTHGLGWRAAGRWDGGKETGVESCAAEHLAGVSWPRQARSCQSAECQCTADQAAARRLPAGRTSPAARPQQT